MAYKRQLRDYLLLTPKERRMLDNFDMIPEELVPFFERMLFGTREESAQAEQELMAIAQIRGLLEKEDDKKE